MPCVAWSYTEITKTYTLPLFLQQLWQHCCPWSLAELHFPCCRLKEFLFLLVNYLYLTGRRAFGLFLCALRFLSWFFDEGKWFIHHWCVVHMAGQRAGGAGGWTPGGCGTLWDTERCWCCCCSLDCFTTASAQCPLSPETVFHWKMPSLYGHGDLDEIKWGEFTFYIIHSAYLEIWIIIRCLE